VKSNLKARLVKLLVQQLELCENFIEEKAKTKSAEFARIFAVPDDQLPLHVNDDGLSGELVKARLAGEDIDIPKWHIQALYDVTFDFEEYKAFGYNDGELNLISMMLSELGEDDLSARAELAKYSE